MSAERGDQAIDNLMKLERGWDSYNGAPITVAARRTARHLITVAPYVVPCSDGGIQLEWHEEGVDFEVCIKPDGTQETD